MIAWMLAMAAGAAQPPKQINLDGATPRWVQSFGSAATDWTNRAVERDDGRIVAAGFLNRDDKAPSPDWNAFVETFDGVGRRISGQSWGGMGVDAAWAVRPRPDGSFVIGGISAERAGGDMNAALVITSERADSPTSLSFGGSGDDRATDVIELSDRNLLLVGQTDSTGAGGADVFLVKTDSSGKEIWRKTYGGKSDDRGFFAIATSDGGAIVAGVTGPRGAYDLLLMRVSADGALKWRRVVAGSGNDATHGIAWLPGGKVLLAGYGSSWGGRDNDISLLVFDETGGLVGHQSIGGPGDDRVQFAASDANGGAWLTGYTKSFSKDWRMLIAKVDARGQPEAWLGAVGGDGDMNGSTVHVMRGGDLLLGGHTTLPSGGEAQPDAFLTRISPQSIDRRRDGIVVRAISTKCVVIDAVESRCE